MTEQITRDGWARFEWPLCPIHTCAIGLPRDVRKARSDAGQPVPPDLAEGCLLDTGASHSYAQMCVYERLGVKPIPGFRAIAGGFAENAGTFEMFMIDLVLGSTTGGPPLVLRNFPFASGAHVWPPGHPPLYHVVIGWDVLRYCRFEIDGQARLFKLESQVREPVYGVPTIRTSATHGGAQSV